MKKPRIKIPSLPSYIIRQYPSNLYKCARTNKVYTLRMLQELYGTKPTQLPTEIKQELTEEQKDELITSQRWDLKY